MKHSNREHSLRVGAMIAVLFGLLTLASGGRVLFGSDAVRQAAGSTVGFVVWFNFLAGFAYVVAGSGLSSPSTRGMARPTKCARPQP